MKPATPDPALVAAIRDTVAAARRHLDTIERHLPEALRRAAIPTTRDGYPRRASGAPPASSTTPAVVHHVGIEGNDDESALWAWCECGWLTQATAQRSDAESWAQQHEDENTPAVSYSDPTGEATVSGGHCRDDVARDARRARTQLDQVVIRLDGIAALTTGITRAGANLTDPTDWCTNHLRHGHHEPRRIVNGRAAGEWCRWCTDFATAQGGPPPKALIEQRARGDKISDQDVQRAMRQRAS
jgi:hypothetical protein